ncbi:hypothetical protein ACFQX6_57590 [Streptosporangium lutulentum]
MTVARIALVGDRSPSVQAHVRIPSILEALRERDESTLDAYWIPTTEAQDLDGFDGVWMLPGSPYRSEAGAVNAARIARERGIPFLGTCGGFQHTLLEYARNVLGLPVAHAENDPDADDFLLLPLACSLAAMRTKSCWCPARWSRGSSAPAGAWRSTPVTSASIPTTCPCWRRVA